MALSTDTQKENTSLPSLIAKVRVSVPIFTSNVMNVKSEFDYFVASTMKVERGSVVQISFANRIIWGVVFECNYETTIQRSKLKPILSVSEVPPINNDNLEFLQQVSEWTMAPFGQVLRMMLCVPNALKNDVPKIGYTLPSPMQNDFGKISKSRRKIIAWCMQNPPAPANIIASETGVSNSTVLSMVKAGGLKKIEISLSENQDTDNTLNSLTRAIKRATKLELSPEQVTAATQINDKKSHFSVDLLDGVTGSGKTEVYFELVKKQVLQGRQCLILLPEIALTTSWVERFKKWFGFIPNIWHSGIVASKKKRIWREINSGHPGVVVGARSALFLPFSNLGAVIVDEEHDPGYKQEEQVIYHARDMAILRAKHADCLIVLATATPSLESWTNVQSGRYQHIKLANRYGLASMPDIQTIDLMKFKPELGKWISAPIVSDMQHRLDSDQQILLYLNRRGYAPLAVCSECGVKQSCHQCDSLMVTHRLSNQLRCHQCGFSRPFQNRCQSCGENNKIQLVGPGVERLAEEVYQLFPDSRVTILSSDTLTNPAQMALTIQSIEEGEVDIIIGTQMVAKGHHFPKLTCVAVIDGDLGLSGGDLRATERTYQMLTQVAGRSGRENKTGTVYIQTSEPTHPVLKALKTQKRNAYFELELKMRKIANMPPYRRLASIIFSSPNEKALSDYLRKLASHRPQFENVQIYGPAPAPIYQIKGRYRFRFLINAPKQVNIQKIIYVWNASIPLPANIRRQIDIDPYNFM